MSHQQEEPNQGSEEQLREVAKERMEAMPGETALGNPDPAAGGEGDPRSYEGNRDLDDAES